MGLNAILALVPDRPHVQLIFLDAEGGFGLRELDVGLPELLIAPINDVRAQEIGTFRECGPVIKRVVAGDAQAKAGGAGIGFQRNCEARGGALVLLQDAADLAVHRRRVAALLWTSDARGQAFERRGDAAAELVVHRLLLAAPIRRAAPARGL